MFFVFLASFVAGLAVAVRVMMYGVERPRDEHPAGERSFRLSPPLVVAFCCVFGLVGYVLTQAAGAGPRTAFVAAAAAGVIAAVAAGWLVKRWWRVIPEHDVDDPRYVLQGQIAHVVATIPPH